MSLSYTLDSSSIVKVSVHPTLDIFVAGLSYLEDVGFCCDVMITFDVELLSFTNFRQSLKALKASMEYIMRLTKQKN